MFGENFEKQCKLGCWGVGLISGIMALYLMGGEAGFIAAVMVAVALGVFTALVLQQLVCWEDDEEEAEAASAGHAPGAPVPSAPKPAVPMAPAPAPGGPVANPPKPNPPVAEEPKPILPNAANPLNARAGMGKTLAKTEGVGGHAEAEAKPAKTADKIVSGAEVSKGGNAAASAVDPTFTSGTTDAEAGAAPAEATPDYDGDGVHEGESEGTKPESLEGPRGGKADNLKEIKGVGPKLEQLLHSMGFYHFDQIANWTPDEVAWVDANLKGFKGRVSRDNWIDQAKILASGGETEFSKRVDEGDVY